VSKDLKLVLFSGDNFTNMVLSTYNEEQFDHPPHISALFDHVLPKPVTKPDFLALLQKFPELKD
jgi:hypothetical protein